MPVDHLHGHVVASTLGDDPVEAPTSAWWRAAATPSSRVDEPALRGARPDPRRRCRRGLRQGCAAARPRLSGRAGGRPPGALGRSRGLRLPAQRTRRARLQLQRAEDRAPVRSATWARRPWALRETSHDLLPAIIDALVSGPERRWSGALERLAIGGGVAANSSCARRWPGWACRSGCLRWSSARTRGDDRRRGAFLEPLSYPDYLSLDAAARL